MKIQRTRHFDAHNASPYLAWMTWSSKVNTLNNTNRVFLVSTKLKPYWNFNFPLNPLMSVCWLVGRSVCHYFQKGQGRNTSNTPIGALVKRINS